MPQQQQLVPAKAGRPSYAGIETAVQPSLTSAQSPGWYLVVMNVASSVRIGSVVIGFRVRLLDRCYDGRMLEIWRFVRAVSRYWAILLTGSALAGLMIGLAHYLGASLSWGIFLAFGGGLVLVFFLIWRDEHRARLEVEQKLFVPATLQAAIGRLVVLKEQGDHHLSATVRTEEDFQQWTTQETAWREDVVDWLYEEFSPADRSLF